MNNPARGARQARRTGWDRVAGGLGDIEAVAVGIDADERALLVQPELADGKSALGAALDAAAAEHGVLGILDELFRGTNSVERVAAARVATQLAGTGRAAPDRHPRSGTRAPGARRPLGRPTPCTSVTRSWTVGWCSRIPPGDKTESRMHDLVRELHAWLCVVLREHDASMHHRQLPG
jgi:hypothetical protein